ncbi:MAG: hypothetical protein J5I93_16885 [Pirellulaceae bacterium]|nr:hypothetical protein [Pirellulaceae bacterium]
MKSLAATAAVALLLTALAASWPLRAQDAQRDASDPKPAAPQLDAGKFGAFRLRAIGPALMSGRVADMAIDPVKTNVWYVAAGSGNLWKTVNAGTTWTPIFDHHGSYSIGCVTIDPNNRHVVWVGTGEDVGGRHVGYGDGVYRSLDGGKSFQNLGLKATEHIARILVDPRNSDVVYVAAQGPLWSPGGERGLYKTTDGGKSWRQVLAKGPYTGVTDVVFDPRNPDVLYAATHQRQRTVWALLNGGPETGIHKSTDAGETWRQLGGGLPGGDKGKIGLAVSPQQPDVVYATVELPMRTGGFYRSSDAGESWSKMSDYASGGTGPHYYQEIFCDPHRFDVVYHMNVRLGRTEDGGRTWSVVESDAKHVDNHAIAFHPTDPDFLLVGCDGGVYKSYDYGRSFAFVANLPLTQFYKLSLDNDWPFYHVVGGTQDNNTQYGPTRTDDDSGIRNADWRITIGGDGHDCAIDPEDPNIIYCESQQGYLRRFDRRTGESVDIRPQPAAGEEELRFNWDSPILISPHDHKRLYFGSKKLHRSDDRGDSWTTISPDLSRALDRFKLKIMDRVWSIDAIFDLFAMSQYGNITSISESPLVEGLIYAGTDDGLIQVTEDGGRTWRKIERIFDVPEFAFVNDIKADLHDPDTVYAALSHDKAGDFKPYLVKSTDQGRTWSSIAGDLPDRHLVWRIVQDHVNPQLFFAGTEFGLFFTLNGGQNWLKLTGGMPTIPVRDLEIQQRENDLVAATFGRGFYVLDDYSPLRGITAQLLADHELLLLPVRPALQYVPQDRIGGGQGSQGDSYYTAANPPFGAVITYHLRDALQTRQARREADEAKVRAAGGDNPYPGWDALKQEEREPEPGIVLTIRDAQGNEVRRLSGPSSAGFHRVAWDLCFARFDAVGGSGPLVPPGKYTVSASKRVDDQFTALGKPQTIEVLAWERSSLTPRNRLATLKFQQQAGGLLKSVNAALGKLSEALEQLGQIQDAIRQSVAADPGWLGEARELELQLLDLKDKLQGDSTRARRSQTAVPPIAGRARNAYYGTLGNTYGPTDTQRQEFEIASREYAEIAPQLKSLLEVKLPALGKQLDDAGVPWTAGRRLPR